jgi:DNA-binding helix-hairpin-helix protein with protein kinase domain
MAVFTGLKGYKYPLAANCFSSGGEGELFDVTNKPGDVAKVYKNGKAPLGIGTKIRYMIEHKPSEYIVNQVAWPLDMLKDDSGILRGFIMKKLNITNELGELYKYPQPNSSLITTEQKIIVATNIALVISEVHKEGYIFGDFNPRNIGVDMKTCHVAFLDTDSYHIVIDKANNNAFRCKVGFDGYIAPELLQKIENEKKINPANANYEKAPLDTFTIHTDNFALAIHIFKLLMNGYTPFNGVSETSIESMPSPGVGNEAIKRNSYCFQIGNKPLSQAVPPLKSLPPYISHLFARAFIDGRTRPEQRPKAEEWYKAMDTYHKELKQCKTDPRHYYYKSLNDCPYCKAAEKYRSAFVLQRPQQKTFSSPSVVMPPKVSYTKQSAKSITRADKNWLVFYLITLFLSSFAAWSLAAFVVPSIFHPDTIATFIEKAAPYVIFLAGIVGNLIYNARFSSTLGAKDYIASVISAVLFSTVIGTVFYIVAVILPILIVLGILLLIGSLSNNRN